MAVHVRRIDPFDISPWTLESKISGFGFETSGNALRQTGFLQYKYMYIVFVLIEISFRRWRRIRGRLSRQTETNVRRPSRRRRCYQDLETGKLGQGSKRLSNRSVHHGTIRASERHLPPRRGYQVQPSHDHHRVHGKWFPRYIRSGLWNICK